MNIGQEMALTGNRAFTVSRSDAHPSKHFSLLAVLALAMPRLGLSREVNLYRIKNLPHFWRGFWRVAVSRVFGISNLAGVITAFVQRASGETVPLGVVSCRVVTDAGVGFIVDAFQNIVELENMKFHGFGTGTTAEAAGQTALVTELTTAYATDNTRPTGSTTEGASANIYRTVGTLSPDASVAITEHGIFSQAATGGGVLLDRSVFSAINLVSGDSLQITYDLTFTSGG
jgi:hypothetical protein